MALHDIRYGVPGIFASFWTSTVNCFFPSPISTSGGEFLGSLKIGSSPSADFTEFFPHADDPDPGAGKREEGRGIFGLARLFAIKGATDNSSLVPSSLPLILSPDPLICENHACSCVKLADGLPIVTKKRRLHSHNIIECFSLIR